MGAFRDGYDCGFYGAVPFGTEGRDWLAEWRKGRETRRLLADAGRPGTALPTGNGERAQQHTGKDQTRLPIG